MLALLVPGLGLILLSTAICMVLGELVARALTKRAGGDLEGIEAARAPSVEVAMPGSALLRLWASSLRKATTRDALSRSLSRRRLETKKPYSSLGRAAKKAIMTSSSSFLVRVKESWRRDLSLSIAASTLV